MLLLRWNGRTKVILKLGGSYVAPSTVDERGSLQSQPTCSSSPGASKYVHLSIWGFTVDELRDILADLKHRIPLVRLMPDYYFLWRAGITRDRITARRAGELLVEAKKNEVETGIYGDLETGFYFWSFDRESGLRMICFRVVPVPADEVCENVS